MRESRVNFAIIGDFIYDTTITPKGTRRSIGGSAYNTAVAAASVAEPHSVGVVGRVGNDFTDGIAALERRTINTQGVTIVPDGKTAYATITEHEDNTREQTADFGVAEIVDTKTFPDSYRHARFIHLASSHPRKQLEWLSYLRSTTPKGTIISADAVDFWLPGAADEMAKVLQAVDLVFINENELSMIQQQHPNFTLDKPTVLKKGKAGAAYIDMQEGIEITVDAPQVDVQDTTGAGDTLAGVFLARRARGAGIEEALRDGVNLASKTVTDFGVEHINPLN